ncbi:GNAT family N-acetyltransferase [Variovorax sp. PAMC26660]|uniref:GNAT family N-acetyltransferase n=1 Tax=Variovorax sp. PAMC26660 TaxID=2762322 RepID=UPI00164CE5C6|nr:GNAT family N-acetyltransferase [Variovorax sp. PAMC26660]QNK66624.1 GNAT family N-acetyltransferase [Variovorax sp. PAMC26660]
MLEQRVAHSRHFATTVFDPPCASEAQWDNFLGYWRVRNAEDAPGDPTVSDADTRLNVLRPTPLHVVHRVMAADEHGRFIGSVSMSTRKEGTPDWEALAPFVEAWGGVLRPHRRQGVASTLLRALLALMETQGKTTATLRAHLPEGHAFLRTIGAVEKHRAIENRLSFDGLDWEALGQWQAQALATNRGLRTEIHVGRVPLERLEALMAPLSTLLEDAPTSALARGPMRYELEGFLAWYADLDLRGGEHFLVLLLDGDELAAVCDASWNPRLPDRMWQALTAVARPWRGKGLAKAVKAAMLRLVHERHPQVAMAITNNAEVNAPMLAINHQLGFVAHRHDGVYQIGTESLRAYLSSRPLASREQEAQQ